jgi:hypothetical protein
MLYDSEIVCQECGIVHPSDVAPRRVDGSFRFLCIDCY